MLRRTRVRGKVGDRGKRSRGCEVRRRSVWGGLCSRRRRRRSRRPFPRDVVRGGCGARVKESALEVRDSVRSRGGVGSACPFALQVTTNHPHQFANMLLFPLSPFGCCCCVVINAATTLWTGSHLLPRWRRTTPSPAHRHRRMSSPSPRSFLAWLLSVSEIQRSLLACSQLVRLLAACSLHAYCDFTCGTQVDIFFSIVMILTSFLSVS
jgi:hypothetical protein